MLTSQTTLRLLPERGRQAARALEAFTLKGKSENIRVCESIWQNPDNTVLNRIEGSPPESSFSQATLRYHRRKFVLDERSRSLSLGREIDNSRQHARFERRRDKFVFIDNSTNGTYISFEGGA